MNHVKINFDASVRSTTGLASIARVAKDCFGAILSFNFHSICFNNVTVTEAWAVWEALQGVLELPFEDFTVEGDLPSPSRASIQSASIHGPRLASLKTSKCYVEAVKRGSGSLMSIERQTLW
uniref:RNase H type-1 domain-containing protein n=1 Tax=Nelumbo nucifera TaxID=4432 RepID=A0A822Y8Y5_NELNU|nr:TPA_asm: hypothetical protein HUJ06_009375 [Nelumbo nucifera]